MSSGPHDSQLSFTLSSFRGRAKEAGASYTSTIIKSLAELRGFSRIRFEPLRI